MFCSSVALRKPPSSGKSICLIRISTEAGSVSVLRRPSSGSSIAFMSLRACDAILWSVSPISISSFASMSAFW